MATEIDLVEGWTGDIDMRLLADGSAVNLTGTTVALVLKDRHGNAVSTSGDVSVYDSTGGIVRYSPDATDLSAVGSPFTARFRVTASGDDTFFPSGEPDRWRVFSQ